MEAPDPPEYRGRVVRARREHYPLPDGRPASLDAVRYRHVAVVVPLLPDGRVVLLRQFRPIVAAVLWEVPAGTIGWGGVGGPKGRGGPRRAGRRGSPGGRPPRRPRPGGGWGGGPPPRSGAPLR